MTVGCYCVPSYKNKKMKKLLTLLTIIPLTIFCQDTETTTKKYSIGLTFSPDYCYRTLKPDASSKWIADDRNSHEIPKIGYTAGLNLAVNINKRFTFETGLLFSDKGEQTKQYSVVWVDVNGQVDPTMPVANTFIYHYLYLDIPIKVNYYILTGRAKLFLTAGISPNIFLTQKTVSLLEYSDGHTTINTSSGSGYTGFAIINLTFIAGLGFEYNFTKKVYLKIEPIYRRSITSIVNAPIKGYLYSSGLNIGLFYKL